MRALRRVLGAMVGRGARLGLLLLLGRFSITFSNCVQGNCTSGFGLWKWDNGDQYFGHFDKNTRHGLGAYYATAGSKYEGSWVHDQKDGYGTWTWPDGTRYSGKWEADFHHGYGIYLFSGGEMYEGDYYYGKRHGRGLNTWPSGDRYEGDFDSDKRKGSGRLMSTSGSRYEGDWKDDKIDGHGVWVWQNGNLYEGAWKNGERSGNGMYWWPDGSRHIGEWEDSKEHGHGKQLQLGLWWGNRTFEGRWKKGRIQEQFKLSHEIYSAISKSLWNTQQAQHQAQFSAEKAQESARKAREAAKFAMENARKAQEFVTRDRFRSSRMSKTAVQCTPPPPFEHGHVYPNLENYHNGDVVSLSCDAGFQLVGGFPLRECEDSGTWSDGARPVCQPDAQIASASNLSAAAFKVVMQWMNAEQTKARDSAGFYSAFQAAPGSRHQHPPLQLQSVPTAQGTSHGVAPEGALGTGASHQPHHPTLPQYHQQQQHQQQQQQRQHQYQHHQHAQQDPHSLETEDDGEFIDTEIQNQRQIEEFLGRCRLSSLLPVIKSKIQAQTLNQLLVHITRQETLASASIRPINRRRLLSCAQDYMLQKGAYERVPS